MQTRVTLIDGMHFEAEVDSGHTIPMDTAREWGGQNLGARPIELLLAGLGGCTAFDVLSILRKARQEVTGYQVLVEGDRADTDPKVFTSIHVEHVVRGRGISEDTLRRAIDLSEHKYCSVSAMLEKVARITTSYRIIEED